MTSYGPRLLTPPTEGEERYPYGLVWRGLVIESGILVFMTVVIFVVVSLANLGFPEQIGFYLSVILAAIPCILWVIITVAEERRAIEPRHYLFMTFSIAALAASAISLPFIESVLEVDKWLPLSNAIYRIVGYTITVGVVQEMTKYLVLRFVIWPQYLRVRVDSIAFGIAAGIGYATVVNLDFVFRNAPAPIDIIALRIFANYCLQVSGSIITAYGLAEVRFSDPNPFFMTFTMATAAVVTGIAIPIRTGLVSASFTLTPPVPRPILGLGFSIVLLVAVIIIVSTLINNAERRALEAKLGREE